MKELRLHPERYEGQKVAFDAVIIGSGSNSVYVESFDAETDRHYGMYVYYGRSFTGPGLSILVPGNEVRIVGTMQYYENGGIYEITSLTYWAMDPTHPDNLQLRNTGLAPSYPLTSAEAFNSQVTVETEEGSLTFVYPALVLDTSIAMEHLVLAAAAEGLGTCWICAFSRPQMNEALNIRAPWSAFALSPIGYAAGAPRPFTRKALAEVVEIKG